MASQTNPTHKSIHKCSHTHTQTNPCYLITDTPSDAPLRHYGRGARRHNDVRSRQVRLQLQQQHKQPDLQRECKVPACAHEGMQPVSGSFHAYTAPLQEPARRTCFSYTRVKVRNERAHPRSDVLNHRPTSVKVEREQLCPQGDGVYLHGRSARVSIKHEQHTRIHQARAAHACQSCAWQSSGRLAHSAAPHGRWVPDLVTVC